MKAVDVPNSNTHKDSVKVSAQKKKPILHQNSTSKKARDTFEGDLGTRMFEFTESVVDEEVEEGLLNTKVGYSRCGKFFFPTRNSKLNGTQCHQSCRVV